MGDFESGSTATVSKSSIQNTSRMPKLVGALMLILAILSPFAVLGYSDFFNIQSLFWMLDISQHGFNLVIIPLGAIFTMFPFLLIRSALPYQMVRYYHGKTTRTRTAVVAILSESPFLAVYVLQLTFSLIFGGMMFGISLPFPITIIIGLLLLWRKPIPKVTVPWDGTEKPRQWWDESSNVEQEPSKSEGPW